MDEIPAGLDPDELTMDLDDPEGSDLEDDDEDIIDDPSQSPFQLPSSGPGSTTTSVTSSPPNNEDLPPSFNLSGKPLVGIKRGRGRPRREGGKPTQKRPPGAPRARKVRLGMPRGGGRGAKHFRQFDRFDFDMSSCITPSPGDEIPMLDPETGALIFTDREKPLPTLEYLPYAPEQWPGKVCAFCNLGEKSQLGQGEMLRLNCPEGFTPQRVASDQNGNQSHSHQLPEKDSGDKSPRGPVTCRRQKSFNKCRHPSLTSEYVDELTIIGYNEEPEVNLLFESNGHFYVHRSCALWSKGVKKNENATLDNVGSVVLESSSRKCSFCNHFGASVACKMQGCNKFYHYPCATASGAFQELPTLTVFCNNHVGQAALVCESSVCYTCKVLGDIANLMYCSSCGEHYHGICVGLAQHPGVRAGWQCRKCRICQVCRITGDESKLMTCEQCDKVYHAGCQRPIVTSIPKYGWKCRCCRVCGDCGSRTPGAGLSSRWHAHYTVCDSCYQQRNKGFSCPLCRRAYRAHAHREMVQCTMCRKFVHGTCDPDADLSTYHQRKEAHPEYEYACTICKNLSQPGRTVAKRQSTEDPNELSASQESLYDDISEFDSAYDEIRSMGLGKGKPYNASKIAKKRLGYATGMPGRPKGVGKGPPGFMKKARLAEFGRKRGPKAKMRGVFGVPGVGLQRPVSDGKNDEEPGVENRLVLCSAKDKFVLTQDICVMCGALGTDQEGCLIACVQCGQCYHPYCVNVKVTKVILQKGWRCLDCTVCEGCGQRNDEGRLILCDDCDVSYHIYCMDPPLDYVPHGNWKCKWCAVCQSCGATDPGFNCTWMNSCTECGPCASHVNCPSCNEPYSEGELIIQCVQCERWLHGTCDYIKTEEEAEKCAEEGYNCNLCRPRDIPPPHLAPSAIAIKPPTPTKSPTELRSNNNHYIDGVCLSEFGHHHIKALSMEYHGGRRKGPKKKLPTVQDKEAGIMATIESVVAGGNADNSLEDAKLELVDVKDEPQELYKEGMLWTKEDGPPPEGFTVFTMESGMSVLRRKRQRNLQKLGIGGFLVRMRGTRGGQDNDDIDMLPGQTTPTGDLPGPLAPGDDKPKRKPIRRKIKSKLAETFPAYLQEAFFGKDLMEVPDYKKEVESDESDEERLDHFKSIQLSQDELKAVAAVTPKTDKLEINDSKDFLGKIHNKLSVPKEEDDADDLKDMLALPSDLLDDNDLVNSIINEDDDDLAKTTESLDALADSNLPEDADLADTLGSTSNSKDTKDELSDILGPHFNLEAIPNMNSKDVEDIFKGVLTDESQESQESNLFPIQSNPVFPPTPAPQNPMPNPISMLNPVVRPTTLPNVNQSALNSPHSFPPQSPYHSEYSNSPQFSPAFSEPPPSPWVGSDNSEMDSSSGQSTYNQRSSEKMKADESLCDKATISAVLYANVKHPEWKSEYPIWTDRYKQILKKWRTLSQDQKAPFLQQARDNRSQQRMKKTQQDQEKIVSQQKTAREAEQERQWKQLQALRQQQAQQQQNVIHEQRVQAIARVQRHIVDPNQGLFSEQPSPLQGNTPQELSPVASPSSRQFLNMGIKSPTFVLPPGGVRTPTPQSPLDFQVPPTPDIDPYAQQPGTPKPGFQPRMAVDPYAQQPGTPRPQFAAPRPQVQGYANASRPEPDINRQLRDLLQRQQFKKLDEQLLPGKTQQRIWPPTEGQEVNEAPVSVATTDQTFRQPLPPSIARPRGPVPIQNVVRGGMVGMRMPQLDPRMQGADNRMRLLLQQQQQRLMNPNAIGLQQAPQQFIQNAVRFPPRPVSVEQFEQAQQLHAAQAPDSTRTLQAPPSPLVMDRGPVGPRPPAANPEQASTEQEIPDNVTAEIEKLEQENGTMTEFTSVGDILGLDDDDMLLDEMGADFNILEYADPELETFAGDKTNILLDLELDEVSDKKEKVNNKTTGQAVLPTPPVSSANGKASTTVPPTQTQPPLNNIPQPPPQQQQAPPTLGAPPPQQQLIQQTQQPPPIQVPGLPPASLHHLTPQQIQQQMMHQVQQAANQGRPMPPGSRLQTPDGIIGIVKSNNTVHLQVPHNYQQRLLMQQLQNQKLQMRITQKPGPRMVAVNQAGQQVVHHSMGLPAAPAPRMPVNAPPPPPPPYPGPPPPYPGNATPQQQPQEQPLLLEELLEQEKREQEKQQHQQNQTSHQEVTSSTGVVDSSESLLSDQDFERLKADVFSGMGPAAQSQKQTLPQWQQQTAPVSHQIAAPAAPVEAPNRVFNANLLPAPPLPPENIVTEQDKQTQLVYEHWLNHQNNVLTQQLKYYETEVQKLRKIRKSLNSKQRQLKKSGNQLPEADAAELQRVSSEQAILQKQLESTRKQNRQHGMLIQEYRNKQQAKQNPGSGPMPTGQSPLQQIQSPLGPPASSPIHHPSASQSPMMSPSASPMTQHNSPMNSPRPLVSQSPGLGSVQSILQSPGGIAAGSGMSPMQPSPRIGTPHSQGDGSPAPSPSPSQVCLPPPGPRMTSPHRRLVTSPVGYTDLRQGNPNQARFRNPIDMAALQQRMRMQNFSQNPLVNMQQKPGTPSPLNSPPAQQLNMNQQQLLQNKLQQQALLQQQQQQQGNLDGNGSNDPNLMQRAQLLHRQNLVRQQQQTQQQAIGQPQPLTPQQHQNMLHQQKLLQQQQLAQIQARLQQQQQAQQQQLNNPPQSPLSMPPKSPMINQQIMSPHSMPASPMPPQSPMSVRSPAFSQSVGQPPSSPMRSSPMPRSPMVNQIQSPMSMRSPAMPERPTSVENPGTPRTPYNPQNVENMQENNVSNTTTDGGGGNPRNPVNPIPFPFGRFGSFKLGLRGGSPMWGGFGRGAKRVPTPPVTSTGVGACVSKPIAATNALVDSATSQVPPKPKKESHYSKVSILKKKSAPTITNRQSFVANKVSSLVSSDYNEFDDSSSTPPVTPPPSSSTSRNVVQKTIHKKIAEETKEKAKERLMILQSPEPKQIHEIIDYDDDNNTVLSGEVSLSSVAQQNDGDDIEIETLSQNDLTEDLSSPLEADQITDEYLLFPGNMVVEEEVDDYASENMHFVIRSPTTSDDEYIMQGKTKKYNIVSSEQLMAINDTPESPEQEEMNVDPSPEPTEDEENEVEESISTKEDFEELIDEGSRKEKLKNDGNVTAKHINEFHKYAATTVYSFPPKASGSQQTTARIANINKMPQKISLITPLVSKNDAAKELIIAPNAKIVNHTQPTSKVTSIILTPHPVRSNVLTPKIVSAGGQPITIVSANSKSKFTVPIISASAVRQLSNIKVIDKSISLTTHDSSLPKKIFEDDSVSPDSSNCEEDAKSKDYSDEKLKDSPITDETKSQVFAKNESFKIIKTVKSDNMVVLNKQPENVKIEKKEQNKPKVLEKKELHPIHTIENVKITNIITKQRIPSPIIAKSSSPVIIRSTPELKMTAQVFQETSQNRIQISTDTDCNSTDDTKSVVISIPSPTPSQEQMLDDIAMRAYETRRHGTAIPGTFDSFEDVLDMFENITAEPGTILDEKEKVKQSNETFDSAKKAEPEKKHTANNATISKPAMTQMPVTVTTTSTKSSVVPQLSPLSQPTELTTNMATASQQLRNLLSLQTTTSSSPTNVETLVKTQQKNVVTTASTLGVLPQQPAVTVTSVGTVVSSIKQLPVSTKTNTVKTQFTTNVVSSSTTPTFTTHRNVGGIQLMPDHSKLPPVTQQQPSTSVVTTPHSNTVVVHRAPLVNTTPTTTPNGEQRKPSLTLTAMLQNQPAATPTTKTTPDSITAASLLATPVSISRGFNTALVQAQPNVSVSSIVATTNNVTSESVTAFRSVTTTTNLLHTQLTKVRNKSVEEPKEIKVEAKPEEAPKTEEKNNFIQNIKTEPPTSKYLFNKTEESQNVLLKKLLQNTACASTQSPAPSTTTASSSSLASTNPSVSAEDTNLTKTITPTLSSLLPPAAIKTEPPSTPVPTVQSPAPKPPPQRMPIRETSFVSNPVIQQLQVSTAPPTIPQQLIRTSSRDDLLSPRSTCSQDSSLQTPPLIAKKEQLPYFSQQTLMLNQQEVKKELMDESSQHSEVSDHSRPDVHMKEEIEVMDHEKMMAEKEELKKQKRRMYQQKRRQNQILKDAVNGQPKKRPRKNSKFDEDYDSFIDGVLGQLRTLPAMNVSEPLLNRNYGVVSIFGTGDMSKLGTKEYDSRYGDLLGTYGNAVVPNFTDFYNTKPHGDEDPLPEKPPASTQRGFYDQEFPLIRFDCEEDRRFDAFCREDTPDSIISSSSPECTSYDPPSKFMGLKLISDDESEDDDVQKDRMSPVVPIIAPIPIRLKPTGGYLQDFNENKENICKDLHSSKSKFVAANQTAKDNANVTVTLTLTSSAAEDIMGVLRDLANILHIPAPTSYQIVERTNSPPSQKLGLYRTKGKDGKEGAPIDIQSILNGQAKFCKHCDVVILNNMIKRKVSDLPFLAKDSELLSEGEELYFCSIACYTQFALMHRSPSISEDKAAAAIIDHLSQDKLNLLKKNLDTLEQKVVAGKMEIDNNNHKKDEPMECSDFNNLFVKPGDHLKIRNEASSSPTVKKHKNVRYKVWAPGCLQPAQRHKKPTDKEIMELLYRLGITVTPPKMPDDIRKCIFCQGIGDSVADGPGRLLNFDVDKWVHLNCGLWSDGVYETVNGALMNLENALHHSMTTSCVHCSKMGATIRCFKNRCSSVYHLSCAVKDNCVFYKNKTVYCTVHVPKNEKDNELTTLSVSRRVYINRDENKQVAAVMHHSETNNLLRVGSLIFLSIGQILPHQLQNFHSPNYIYPIGYKIIRFFWSMRQLNKRCRYICSIHDVNGKPEFRVLIQEQNEDDLELKEPSPKGVWIKILDQIARMRKDNQCLQMFPKFATGEDLFGLSEPAVVRVLESLPGIETLNDYKFKYGRNPLLELPLAINPSGAARTEPKLKNQQHWKRPHTQRTCGATTRPMFGPTPPPGPSLASFGEAACPYSKQFVHSKSSQYKKMKQEWRNNVYLARSKIQGLGLYAARDLEKHTMVIEYIGEIIRSELAESREKQYEAKNRGIYMFRLDEERVVDATLSGGLARYINHSCNPNCVAEQVEVDRDVRIIIFAKRRIQRGEELAYDYKFEFEDDQHKISCMCGAPNCRKWMN
ncbi:unnamed protein product [Brassicogethes aeneus]|uniref:Histone-lysine N-methyltransferase 2C n=2 Tax=Brassicogethes aeneus TaxID=1431903 RepID=A0A9P0FKJ1_BRAAE|nr:unnamed protein product [Brassicogethes aeneus]